MPPLRVSEAPTCILHHSATLFSRLSLRKRGGQNQRAPTSVKPVFHLGIKVCLHRVTTEHVLKFLEWFVVFLFPLELDHTDCPLFSGTVWPPCIVNYIWPYRGISLVQTAFLGRPADLIAFPFAWVCGYSIFREHPAVAHNAISSEFTFALLNGTPFSRLLLSSVITFILRSFSSLPCTMMS